MLPYVEIIFRDGMTDERSKWWPAFAAGARLVRYAQVLQDGFNINCGLARNEHGFFSVDPVLLAAFVADALDETTHGKDRALAREIEPALVIGAALLIGIGEADGEPPDLPDELAQQAREYLFTITAKGSQTKCPGMPGSAAPDCRV